MNKENIPDLTAMPCVAVVIPVFNTEKYVEQCVESICRQTWSNLEIILVDDGSTDSSPLICDRLAESDTRIKVAHIANGGPSAARNHGVRMTKSGFISFVDSDDFVDTTYIEYLYRSLLATDADISQCGTSIVAASATYKERNISFESYMASTRVKTSVQAIGDMLYQSDSSSASVCGKLYRTSILRNNIFTENLIYEDLELTYRLLCNSEKTAISTTPLYHYRMNPTSLLHTFSLSRADVIDVTGAIEKHISHQFPELKDAARDRSLSAAFNILCITHNYCRQSENDRNKDACDEICRKCWAIIKRNRKTVLFSKRSRLKNKIAVILSYMGGRKAVTFAGRFIY